MVDINVIKVGGAVVEDSRQLQALIDSFAALPGLKVLVHGGGRSATRLAAQMGIETQMVEGRRVTDAAMLRIVTMVYGGLVNKQVVASLQAAGVNALGLTGADMNVIRAHRRPVKYVDGIEVDYGFVGDIDSADGQALSRLVDSGVVPVMAPLSHDGQGTMLNVNADTIAAVTATALAAVTDGQGAPCYSVTLTYCFEKAGVLANPDDDLSVIPVISRHDFMHLKSEGVIAGGMIPKMDNAFKAIDAGVAKVIITASSDISGRHGTTISEG